MASLYNITKIFNLRVAVIVLALLLVLPVSRPSWLLSFDQLLFRAGEALRKVPGQPLPIAIVSLSDTEAQSFAEDPGSLYDLYTLLNRLLARSDTRIAIAIEGGVQDVTRLEKAIAEVTIAEVAIVEQDIPEPKVPETNNDTEQAASSEVIEGLPLEPEPTPYEVIQQYQKAAPHVRRLLDLNRVLVWDTQSNSLSASRDEFVVSLVDSSATRYFGVLPAFLQPALSLHQGSLVPFQHNRVILLDRSVDNAVSVTMPLAVYGHFQKSYNFKWDLQSIQFGERRINSSSHAEIFPPIQRTDYSFLSLGDALVSIPRQSLVLVTSLDEQAICGLMKTLESLEQSNHVFTPFWFDAFEVGLLLVLTTLLVISFPTLSSGAKVLAVCLIITLLVVAQLGWQVTQQQWLPMGIVMQFVIAAAVLLSIAQIKRARELQLIAAAHGARYQLGLQLYRDGRNDDALLAIKECHASEAVLSLMYDIAAQQERKRHYAEAVKTYQSIVDRQSNFKDASQKVEKLIAFSSGGAASFQDAGDIAKTLIVSESTINKPVLGRYEIERELGRGAMGVVYLGRDPKISRQVAIKTLSYAQLDTKELEEFKSRFFREAEAAGRLSHPNIITVYDVGEEHDLAFIAMDYVDGKSLASYVHEDDLLSLGDVCEVVAQVADALAYAHQHQVIHRDIKPGNIMYQESYRIAKVADFGVARIVDSAKTNTGDILGSPLYMSPEQLQGSKVSFQTDIYSLGVTLYQLLTAKLPFTAENLATLTYNIINEKHQGVRDIRPELPKGFTRIVNRSMNKDPEKRFATAAEFAAALRKLAQEEL